MAWSGTSESGKSGAPNMKLPKQLHPTPLCICSSGLKEPMGARQSRNPARQTRPPRRTMRKESKIAVADEIQHCVAAFGNAVREIRNFQLNALCSQGLQSRDAIRVASCGSDLCAEL